MNGSYPQDQKAVWESIFTSRAWGKYPNEDLVRMVSRVERPRGLAIELGCGSGANIGMLYAEGFRVIGVDFSETAISVARGRHPQALYVAQDTRSYDFSYPEGFKLPETYHAAPQVVCDVGHLPHLNDADAAKVVERAYAALQPGGYFLATEILAAGTFGLCGPQEDCRGTPVEDRGFVNFRTLETVEALFSPFEHVEIERISRTYQHRSKYYVRWNVFARK